MKDLEYVLSCLSDELQSVFHMLDTVVFEKITEIRIRRDKPLVVVIRNTSYFIDYNGDLYDYVYSGAVSVDSDSFDKLFLKLCDYSIYNSVDNLKNGYITLGNGARVGVASTAVYNGSVMQSVKDITSLNIRIPRQIKGCADSVLNFLYVNAFPSVIVAGVPNSGKTTLLRDMARQLSDGFNNHFAKVCVVDERNEIAGKNNSLISMDLGVNTDVLCGFSKAKGIELATRTLSPEIIICDEISTPQELDSIKFGFSTGVSFALSIHIASKKELVTKPIIQKLLDTGEFAYIVLLDGHSYKTEIIEASQIYDEILRNDNLDNILNRLGVTIIK